MADVIKIWMLFSALAGIFSLFQLYGVVSVSPTGCLDLRTRSIKYARDHHLKTSFLFYLIVFHMSFLLCAVLMLRKVELLQDRCQEHIGVQKFIDEESVVRRENAMFQDGSFPSTAVFVCDL